MPIEINMPRLSDTMEEGTLVKWRVKVGDPVKSGDTLADVETDKATMEMQSFDEGTVAQLAVAEGETVPVGRLILLLAEKGEDVQKVVQGRPSAAVAGAKAGERPVKPAVGGPAPSVVVTEAVRGAAAVMPGGRLRVSPLARRLAEEHGVDLATIRGTGPDGRIVKRDILAAAEALAEAPAAVAVAAPPPVPTAPKPAKLPAAPVAAPAKLESRLVPVSSRRKTIARRLLESKTTIPHFTVTVTVDMDPLLSLRESLNTHLADQGVKLSVTDFIVRAAALSLLKHPQVNSSWTENGIQMHGAVNVGTAVSIPEDKGGGVVVPTIRDAANKSVRVISAEVKALAAKAREQGLSMEEMSDGTFSISNLGMLGVEHFEAIINPPQAAILAVGAAVQKPVVRGGRVVVGNEMTLTLSADHRVIDGAMAAEFLQTLRTMLENPAVLLV
jgi:pyruvate dehydrogenase E2 component (dihydrolipoamide acetyltransferase)